MSEFHAFPVVAGSTSVKTKIFFGFKQLAFKQLVFKNIIDI